jgi:hypothetical protein
MAALRVRRTWGQSFVNADVVEPWLSAFQTFVVLLDQLERRIRHLGVVVAPLPHKAVGIIIHFRGV